MSGRSSDKQQKRGPRRRGTVDFVFVDWEATQLLLAMQIGMAYDGGAVRVGLTRDLGALAIAIYKGEEYQVEYIKPSDDLLVELRLIVQAWEIPIAQYDDEAGHWLVR